MESAQMGPRDDGQAILTGTGRNAVDFENAAWPGPPSCAVKSRGMVKLLVQSLALIAMMASVINAQCAVSCALQSIAGSPASHAARVDPDHTGHACCPHHG